MDTEVVAQPNDRYTPELLEFLAGPVELTTQEKKIYVFFKFIYSYAHTLFGLFLPRAPRPPPSPL
jgi:hypothetical protein